MMGYSSRQVAWDAVKRGQKDHLKPKAKRGRPKSHPDKVPTAGLPVTLADLSPQRWRDASSHSKAGSARGNVFPSVNLKER